MTLSWILGHLAWTAIVGFVCYCWGWSMAYLDGYYSGYRIACDMLKDRVEITEE